MVRICASLLPPAEMEAGREIGKIADDPGSDTLTADPSSVGIDTPCGLCICAAVALPFRLVFRHFHDQRPGTRPPSFSDSVCQMYRRGVTDPSLCVVHLSNASTSWSSAGAGMAWWMPSKAGERRSSLTVHWLPGMTCVQIIRIGDWFQDFELNKG